MSWDSEEAEATWAEHIADCDACAIAFINGDQVPASGCIDDPLLDDDGVDYGEDLTRSVKGGILGP